MRIAYLLADPGIGVFGTKGASVHVQEMVRAMRAEGHQVTVFCTRLDDEVPADLLDLDVRHLPLRKTTSLAEREIAIGEAATRLAKAAEAEGFDAVYERYSLFSDAGARLATQAPLILEVNAPLLVEQRRHRGLHDAAAAESATARQFAAASVISCVSEPVAEWALTQGAPRSRVAVIPNGVNTARITPRQDAEVPRPDGRLTVGFVGTLKPWHGTELLLEAIALSSEQFDLLVCGTGPEEPKLEELATCLGIRDRVWFLGAVPPAEVPSILHRLDIAVAPYPQGDHYFSPLKIYEYMAAGLPIVASAIGEIPRQLAEGRHGALVPPGNVSELAAALDSLARNPERRRRLGRAARAAAVAEHDWRSRARGLFDLLEGAS